jgi:predicted dehydrogenase
MKKINWGIIGLGNVANKFADGFLKVNNASIKGIASQKKDHLISFQKKFNVDEKFCFDNYKNLISCPDIDIIYIALPNSLHTTYAKECILMNKNVLVEKPAFMNFNDLKFIQSLSPEKKIFFTEGFMYRYLPYFSKVKEIIEENTLGKIVGMESTFNIKVYKQMNFFGINIKKPDYSNRLFNKDLGGGAILDVGCYPLSLSTFINSISYNVEINEVKLENVDTLYCDNGIDIYSNAKLNFGAKFISNIKCSFKDNPNQFTKLNFEYGSLSIDKSWLPDQVSKIKLVSKDKESTINYENNSNIYSYQIENISDQLTNKNIIPTFPSMTLREIEFNTKLLENWINF